MSNAWQEAGREPSIAELLSDPIAVLLRAYDGISEEEVWQALASARAALIDEFEAA